MHIKIIFIVALIAVQAFSAESAPSNEHNVFKDLRDLGFHLTQASSGNQKDKPAQLGFEKALGSKSAYIANGYLSYSLNNAISIGSFLLTPTASAESKLSTTDTTSNDAVIFGLGTQIDWPISNNIDLWASLDAKHESNFEFKTKKIYAEFQLTPTCGIIGKKSGSLYHYCPKQPILVS